MRPVVGLSSGHRFRRSDRQLQRLAKSRQICIPWPNPIGFPKVDAGCADTDLLGKFSNRQPTPDPGVTEIAGKVWRTRHLIFNSMLSLPRPSATALRSLV